MKASATPAARLAAALVLASAAALAGCDRKPTDPPKPSTAQAAPASSPA